MIEISVVAPVYNSAPLVQPFVERVSAVLRAMQVSYQLILVNDGSRDQSASAMEAVCAADSRVKGIFLSRNFGQHYAITAGLQAAQGKWIVLMDSDLQDRPEEIPLLYNRALQGADMVLARRAIRHDNLLKKWTSRAFYRFFGYLTDTRQDATVANFGMYSAPVIQAVLQMKDAIRFFPIMVQWVGFTRATVNVQHDSRPQGKTTYSFSKLFRLAFDMIISFSEKPLRLSFRAGLLVAALSFCIGLVYLGLYLTNQITVPGYTSLVLLISFHLGLTIMFIGIVGLYVGKISLQVKNRPYFIVEKTLN